MSMDAEKGSAMSGAAGDRRGAPTALSLLVVPAATLLALSGIVADESIPHRQDGGTRVVTLASSTHTAYLRAEKVARSVIEASATGATVSSITIGDADEGAVLDEVRRSQPALVLAIGTRAARLAHQSGLGIPIVYAMVLDPASVGLPAPGEVPSDAITGISLDVPLEEQFDLIRSLLPNARRIGVLYDPVKSGGAVRKAGVVARSSGMKIVAQSVRSEADALEAARLLAPSVDAMLAIADPTVLTAANIRPLILFWLRARKPLFGMSEGFVRNGALAALVPDPEEVGRRAGELVSQILSSALGQTPRPEPPPQAMIFLNRASAQHLGVVLSESILARARMIFPEP